MSRYVIVIYKLLSYINVHYYNFEADSKRLMCIKDFFFIIRMMTLLIRSFWIFFVMAGFLDYLRIISIFIYLSINFLTKT